MRELRVSLRDGMEADLDRCKELAGIEKDTEAMVQVLKLARLAMEQIYGGRVNLTPVDLRRIDGLLRQQLDRVREHVLDPSTPAEDPRMITLQLKLTPDAMRERLVMEPSAGASFPKTKGAGSLISLGSAAGRNGSPVQLKLSDGGGPDWIVATDGQSFEAHPTDCELFAGWVFWSGPYTRREAEINAHDLNERGPEEVFAGNPPEIWPVISVAPAGLLSPASPSPGPPKGNDSPPKGRARKGEAGKKGKP